MTELERLRRYVEWNQATRHQLIVAHITLIDAMAEKRARVEELEAVVAKAVNELEGTSHVGVGDMLERTLLRNWET